MKPSLERLLAELIEFGRSHDAARADRRERLRNLEPESARLLWLLARAMRASRVLELGTSNGYSTLWLAAAAAFARSSASAITAASSALIASANVSRRTRE